MSHELHTYGYTLIYMYMCLCEYIHLFAISCRSHVGNFFYSLCLSRSPFHIRTYIPHTHNTPTHTQHAAAHIQIYTYTRTHNTPLTQHTSTHTCTHTHTHIHIHTHTHTYTQPGTLGMGKRLAFGVGSIPRQRRQLSSSFSVY